jgi:hypothetical protein
MTVISIGRMRTLACAAILACLFPALAGGAAVAGPATLVGVARIASDALDSRKETLGGMGSGMMLVPGTWHHTAKGFTADLDLLPDRGWNTSGTVDYQGRLQKFKLTLAPDDGIPGHEGQLKLRFQKSLLFTDARGVPTTGFDPVSARPAANGLPDLPQAGNGHVSLDDEAVAPDHHGGFWVGEEYGPYIYHYNATGCMIGAIRPPEAFIPRRGGRQDFSANSPPAGIKADKGNPDSGRQNNQGLEGLSVSADGRTLYAVNQSALRQDLDPAQVKATRRNVRLLAYDISGTPRLAHEYVIQLPFYHDKEAQNVAAQSELLAIDDRRFLLLCRDSNGGQASKRPNSLYRKVELVDIADATDIVGRFDGASDAVAPNGLLKDGITPAAMTDFVDLNDNSQLNRFGLHNGAPDDAHDLYEKWESLALAPDVTPGSFILLVGSDNDFITQHGHMAGKPYADDTGVNVDTLVMAWRVSLPGK